MELLLRRLLLLRARRSGRLLGLLLRGGRARAGRGGAAGRRRAAGRSRLTAAHAERRDGLLVELAAGVEALRGLELLQRLLRLRAHLAVGRDVQLALSLLDELRALAALRRLARLRLALRRGAFRLLARGRGRAAGGGHAAIGLLLGLLLRLLRLAGRRALGTALRLLVLFIRCSG